MMWLFSMRFLNACLPSLFFAILFFSALFLLLLLPLALAHPSVHTSTYWS